MLNMYFIVFPNSYLELEILELDGYLQNKKIPKLDALIHSAKYYNYFANSVSEAITQKF